MRRALVTLATLTLVASAFVVTRPHGNTVTIATAPVEVPVHEHDSAQGDTHYDHMLWAKGTVKAPRDMWITSFSVTVDGAPSGIVHNLYVANENKSDTWCPENPEILWAAGSVTMRQGKTFDAPYGIRIQKGTPLSVIALIHNGTEYGGGKEYANVRIAVHMITEPARESTRSVPVSFHTIAPGDCTIARPLFPIPPHAVGATFSSSLHPFTFDAGGTIVSAGAHFHGAYVVGAKSQIALLLNNVVVDSFQMDNPFIGESRNPQLLKEHVPLLVSKGDTLVVRATFDNPFPYSVEEGMALVSFYFAPHSR